MVPVSLCAGVHRKVGWRWPVPGLLTLPKKQSDGGFAFLNVSLRSECEWRHCFVPGILFRASDTFLAVSMLVPPGEPSGTHAAAQTSHVAEQHTGQSKRRARGDERSVRRFNGGDQFQL